MHVPRRLLGRLPMRQIRPHRSPHGRPPCIVASPFPMYKIIQQLFETYGPSVRVGRLQQCLYYAKRLLCPSFDKKSYHKSTYEKDTPHLHSS
ncbi:hypothetical protein BDZ89DRAFT_404096 [Hymenopellis radicata]|nr:hypothetical protein BDZ89DRAFT_404096 [Hymenopellis radicata]